MALGRAIARKPQVFLLDEPLSNLDAQLRDGTRAELKQLHQNFGITTIYVTHDQVEAMTLADQIVVLNKGQIQQIGEPQTIYARPANKMVAAFLGSPPMNLLESRCDSQQFWVDTQTLPCPAKMQPIKLPKSQRVSLGIRPEHVQIASAEDSHLQIEVTVVEPLGRETLIRGRLPEGDRKSPQFINLQTGPTVNPKPGERLPLQFDLDRLFVFDSITGERLYPL